MKSVRFLAPLLIFVVVAVFLFILCFIITEVSLMVLVFSMLLSPEFGMEGAASSGPSDDGVAGVTL